MSYWICSVRIICTIPWLILNNLFTTLNPFGCSYFIPVKPRSTVWFTHVSATWDIRHANRSAALLTCASAISIPLTFAKLELSLVAKQRRVCTGAAHDYLLKMSSFVLQIADASKIVLQKRFGIFAAHSGQQKCFQICEVFSHCFWLHGFQASLPYGSLVVICDHVARRVCYRTTWTWALP